MAESIHRSSWQLEQGKIDVVSNLASPITAPVHRLGWLGLVTFGSRQAASASASGGTPYAYYGGYPYYYRRSGISLGFSF